MISLKPTKAKKVVLWALLLRLTVFGIPLIIFSILVFTKWALKNCVNILDFFAYHVEYSVVKKYAHKFPKP
jgi:hypothetical protein